MNSCQTMPMKLAPHSKTVNAASGGGVAVSGQVYFNSLARTSPTTMMSNRAGVLTTPAAVTSASPAPDAINFGGRGGSSPTYSKRPMAAGFVIFGANAADLASLRAARLPNFRAKGMIRT